MWRGISAALACILLLIAETAAVQVTCGSSVKLFSTTASCYIMSLNMPYGTGSGGQAVACNKAGQDALFTVYGGSGSVCARGQSIKCGSKVQLKHTNTGRFILAQNFPAPMSPGNLEISAYADPSGQSTNSHGDWLVECADRQSYWLQDSPIRLKHALTNSYLYASDRLQFNAPLQEHFEVSGSKTEGARSSATIIQVREGIFFGEQSSDIAEEL